MQIEKSRIFYDKMNPAVQSDMSDKLSYRGAVYESPGHDHFLSARSEAGLNILVRK